MSDIADARTAALWQEHHGYLRDVAFRMLGRVSEAEDAVQEAFVRLLGVDLDEINDVRGWLVVVVGRICLDSMGSARVRREARVDVPLEITADAPDPSDLVTLDDNIRMALAVVLERLTPPERAAFVLHDVFQFSFDDVASIVGRSPAACRQLASRARRRVEDDTGPGRVAAGAGTARRSRRPRGRWPSASSPPAPAATSRNFSPCSTLTSPATPSSDSSPTSTWK